jgi:DNA polymerase I-like protein with 3'-5' exonuclease and polymerase domains
VLISADYKQLELRLMAHFSQDPGLVGAFRYVGDCSAACADPFKQLAAKWKNLPSADAVSDEDRTRVKGLAYGMVYGSGGALHVESS